MRLCAVRVVKGSVANRRAARHAVAEANERRVCASAAQRLVSGMLITPCSMQKQRQPVEKSMAASGYSVRSSLQAGIERGKTASMPHKMGVEKGSPRLALSSFLNYTLSHERHQGS